MAIALDGSRWISCRPKFFLPVEVLSCRFRRKLLAFLAEALAEGKLRFQGSLTPLADPTRFEAWLSQLPPKWVVYAKPPFGGPEQVLKYLARYTHRVAISNGRLVSLADDQVSFRWRDSKDGHRIKVMTLEAVEFIRRFLLHILPLGFVKIRHFGFLANRNRAAALLLCREHLKAGTPTLPVAVAFTEQQQRALDRRCRSVKKAPCASWLGSRLRTSSFTLPRLHAAWTPHEPSGWPTPRPVQRRAASPHRSRCVPMLDSALHRPSHHPGNRQTLCSQDGNPPLLPRSHQWPTPQFSLAPQRNKHSIPIGPASSLLEIAVSAMLRPADPIHRPTTLGPEHCRYSPNDLSPGITDGYSW